MIRLLPPGWSVRWYFRQVRPVVVLRIAGVRATDPRAVKISSLVTPPGRVLTIRRVPRPPSEVPRNGP